MEDVKGELSCEGKKYYLAHTELMFKDEEIRYKVGIVKTTQLVCASTIENAKDAIKKQVEDDGKMFIMQNRIDNSIVGE